MHILRKLFGFLLPGGLVFLAAFLCVQRGIFDAWSSQIEGLLPYFILGTGFLLGWRFHRSRLAFVILILMLSERILHFFGPGGAVSTGYEQTILYVVSILLPVNLALFYLVRERGLLNFQGLFRLLFILAQPLTVYFLLREQPGIFKSIEHKYFQMEMLSRLQMPQPVLLVFSAVFLLFLGGSLYLSKPVLRGFFWALVAIGTALISVGPGIETTLYMCTAGLIIILSVIEMAYAMAYHDELTGLPARRSLNTTLLTLGRRYTIAMLDIDFFKKFNDRYGHDVGDQVLCMVASHIRKVGGGGKPFRYGGEEFTVVFPGKSKSDVILHLENLRQSVAGAQFALRGKNRPKRKPKRKRKTKNPQTVSVTISIGAAEPGRNASKPADVIKAADKALYRAKKKGRNCVVT